MAKKLHGLFCRMRLARGDEGQPFCNRELFGELRNKPLKDYFPGRKLFELNYDHTLEKF